MNRILSSEKNKTRDLFWTMFTRTALVATFFLCLGYKTFAQSFGSPTTNPFNLSSSINLSSICFADIDGDGDADMFALKKNTAIIKFWENTGTSSAPNYGSMLPLATSFGSSMGSINIADENGDGLLDLIGVESGSGNVNIIYNMGDAAIPDFNGPSQMIMLGGGGIFDLCFGDLDNDHDLDIVASSISMHQVAYFENMGGGNYNPNMSVNLNFNDFQSRPELSDIDNDGDLDILASSSTGNFVLVKNIGNSASANFDNPTTNPYGLSALATPSFSLYITDLNNNAHAEIFAVDGTNTISYYGTSCGAATPTDNNTNTAKTVCAGGNTKLKVSVNGDSTNVHWYDASTGGNLLVSGTLHFTTPNLSSATSYYVSDSNSCSVSTRLQITVSLKDIPDAPSGSYNPQTCPGTSANIYAYGDNTGTVTWWDSANGGNKLYTGTNFTTPVLNNGITFYAQDSTCGGVSTRAAITVNIQNAPAPIPSGLVSQDSLYRCPGSTTTLTIMGQHITYWTASTGGNYLGSGDSATGNWVTPIITHDNTEFWVQDSTCGGTSTRTKYMVTYPPAPNNAPDIDLVNSTLTVCPGSSALIKTNKNTISYYTASTGGNYIGKCNTIGEYTSPAVIVNGTSIFAQDSSCGGTSPRKEIVVNLIQAPIYAASVDWNNSKLEVCQGTSAHVVMATNTVSFYDSYTGGNYLGRTDTNKIFNTASVSGYTQIYAIDSTCGGEYTGGRTPITLNTIFASDPTVSSHSICSPQSVHLVATPTSSSDTTGLTWWSENNGVYTLLGTGATYNTPVISTATTYYVKDSSCAGISNYVAVPITVSTTLAPPIPYSNAAAICPGTSTVVYFNTSNPDRHLKLWSDSIGGTLLFTSSSYGLLTPVLNATTTFWAQDSNSCGIASVRVPVTVTVKTTTAPPTNTTINNVFCPGGTITLWVAPASSLYNITWWTDSIGGSLLHNGTSYTTPSLNATTTYYVQDSSCVGASVRIPVTAYLNTPIAITTQPQGAHIYTGGSVTFNVVATGGTLSYLWYKDGVSTGATQSNYTSTMNSTSGSGTYYCIISDNCGNRDTSNTMTVIVDKAPIFVDGDNGNDGNGGWWWNSALKTVSEALKRANSGDVIFVKKGIYRPIYDNGFMSIGDSTMKQSLTFRVKSGVKVYGGFAGTESFKEERVNYGHGQVNETRLSGANAYYYQATWWPSFHVVTFLNADSTTVLDGFDITYSTNAVPILWGNQWPWQPTDKDFGGGIYNEASGNGNNSSPIISNCYLFENGSKYGGNMINLARNNATCHPRIISTTFYNGVAQEGGGVNNLGTSGGTSTPVFENCKFLKNSGEVKAAAIYNYARSGNVNARFTNCDISENYSHAYIGGTGSVILNGSDSSKTATANYINCTITNNTYSGAPDYVIYSFGAGTTVNFYNSIVWANVEVWVDSLFTGATQNVRNSIIEKYKDTDTSHHNLDGVVNAGTDYVKFLNFANKSYRLQSTSPCINAGYNSYNNTTKDIAGTTRIQNNIIDMGAYEGSFAACVTDTTERTVNGCSGNSITIGNNSYTSNATDYQNLINSIGCDSIVKTNVVFHNTDYVEIDTLICPGSYVQIGDSIMWGPISGGYTFNLTNQYGCDSTIELWIDFKASINELQESTVNTCQGSQLTLDGSNHALHFENYARTDALSPLTTLVGQTKATFEYFINPTSFGETSWNGGLTPAVLTEGDAEWTLGIDNFSGYNNSGYFSAFFPKVAYQKWTHIAYVFDGTALTLADNIKVYVNGVQQTLTFDTSSSVLTSMDNSSVLKIRLGTDYFSGYMKNFRVWTKALTQQEIEATINTTNSTIQNDANLLVEYQLNQSSGKHVVNTAINSTVPGFDLPSDGSYGSFDTTTCWFTQNVTWSDGVVNGTSFIPTTSHNYIATIVSSNGLCTITDTVAVNVKNAPTPLISGNLSYCFGSSTTLNTDTYDSYSWSTGDTSKSITATTANNAVSVTVVSSGCSGTSSSVILIENATSSSNSITSSCDSYTWNGITYNTNGTYSWTGINAGGCDSVATLVLAINTASTSSETQTTCDTYTWNGTTYNTTGTYSWTGINAGGCDSVATLTLTVNSYPTVFFEISTDTVCGNGGVIALTATPSGGVFSGTGINGNSFDPSSIITAGYVTITYQYDNGNGCSKTVNDSIYVDICSGIFKNIEQKIMVHPNPTNGLLTISTSIITPQSLEIINALGQKVMSTEITGKTIIDISKLTNGIYIVKVGKETNVSYVKVVKQN